MSSAGKTLTYISVLFLLFSLFTPLFMRSSFAIQTNQAVLTPTDDTYIDSGNPISNFGASSTLAALSYSANSGFSNRTEQIWLKFSLVNIPPSATIINALLTLTLSYTIVNQNIGVRSEILNTWGESTLTWGNAPRNYISSTITDSAFVMNSTLPYNWRVATLVTNAIPNGAVSLVLLPTASQGISNGWSIFYSKEKGPTQAPTLTVTYSYYSVSLSLSSYSDALGSPVSITSSTDPPQSGGTTFIQYSTDQSSWTVLATQTGGVFTYNWYPPALGTYYIRSQWTQTWPGGGSYTATSATAILTVTGGSSVLTLSAPSSANLNQTLSITALLRDNTGNPIAGASVFFLMDSVLIGSGITDASGVVKLSYKLLQTAGSHTLVATYTGSSRYSSARAEATLFITPWRVVITSSALRAPLVSLNGKNYTTDSTGVLTIPVNFTGFYQIRVNSPVLTGPGARAAFVKWSDGITSLSRLVNVSSDVALAVFTKQQYYLALQSQYGKPSGTGWYDSGTKASFSVQAFFDHGNGTRRAFTGWSRGGQQFATNANGSLAMDAATNLAANWKKEYYLNIISQYGNPSGTGWYDPGTSVTVSVTSPFSRTNDTRYLTTGFAGTGSAPQAGSGTSVTFGLSTPSSLTFNWKTQYLVRVVTEFGAAAGGGWYDKGTTASISVNQTSVPVNPFLAKRFAGWHGDTNASSVSALLLVDGPKQASAVWADDLTVAYLTGAGVALVLLAGVYFLRRRTVTPLKAPGAP